MIHAVNIEKSFGTLKVLKGVNLDVKKGEVVAIMGASGAGKSTLLQILGTLLSPDKSENVKIEIDGKDISGLGSAPLADFRNKNIGFVFQNHNLLPEFTAVENIMIPSLIGGTKAVEARKKAIELLMLVGLGERVDHKPSQLSGGEAQRVAIARALVNSPAVLFADEPSGNLDTKTKAEIHQLFFDLRWTLGQTIVIVTHDPSLAALCDRTLVMSDGMITE